MILTYLHVFQLVHIHLRFNLQCSLHLHDCQRIREKQSHHFHVDPYWIPFSVRLHASQECSELLTVAVVTIIKRLKCEKTWDTHRNISYHIISYHVVYCCDVSDSDGDEENERMLYVFRMIVGCCQQSLWMLLWQVTSLEYFLHMYAHTFFGYIQYWHP